MILGNGQSLNMASTLNSRILKFQRSLKDDGLYVLFTHLFFGFT